MPAHAPGVRLVLWLLLWEGGGGDDCVVEADIGDVTEIDGIVVPEDADEDRDVEVDGIVVPEDADENRNVDIADDGGIKVAAARTNDGTENNACMVLGSGLPPALPRPSSPHVVGSTPSMDVMSKPGVLAASSPEKLSTCMWQMPFCS